MCRKPGKIKKRNRQNYNYYWRFHAPLLILDRTNRQKMKKDVEDITTNQHYHLDLIDIYRTLQQQKQSTHFFKEHKEHSLRQIISWAIKTSLNKFQWLEIILMLSDRNSIKLEVNNKKRSGKFPKYLESKYHT